jgi:predicted AAA+ superfamily ATPase
MLAHYSGQTWNGSELARAFGVTERTVRHYLDILAGTFVVRILRPWHEDLAKRQVKAPKVYLGDSGMLHTLLGIGDLAALHGHPKVGASWEGFVLPEIVRMLGVRWDECHYWKLHSGAELDLFVQHRGRRLGFEVKFTDAPRMTPSMRLSLECLALDRLYVVHAGHDAFPLAERIEAVPLRGPIEFPP